MYKVGDYLVYKKDVCQVKDIIDKDNGKYYLLVPINDSSLKIQVSINSDGIREIITKNEVDNLIKEIPNIKIIDCDDKAIEYEYRQILSTGTFIDLLKLIKTTYLRNKVRLDNKKKKNLRDSEYMEKAEQLLYPEIGIVLNLTFEEIKNMVEGLVV